MDTSRPLFSWLLALKGFTGKRHVSPVFEIPGRTRQRGTVFFEYRLEHGSALLHLEGAHVLRLGGNTAWEPLTPPLTPGPLWVELPPYVRAVVTDAENVTMQLATSLRRVNPILNRV